MRYAPLPFVLATCLGAVAADSPIADVRFGAEMGVGVKTEYSLSSMDGTPPTETGARTSIDDTPLRVSLGYVRGLGNSPTHTPIVGIHALYGRGGGKFEDADAIGALSASRVDTVTLGLEVEAGYAFVLPSAPDLHIEAAFCAGYIMEEHELSLGNTGSLGLGGEGFETGARLSAVRTFANRWQLAGMVRYLFESEVEANHGNNGSSRVDRDGLSLGLALGYRL